MDFIQVYSRNLIFVKNSLNGKRKLNTSAKAEKIFSPGCCRASARRIIREKKKVK